MKLTKKLENEIREVYNTYWEGYMKGDVDKFSAILDEDVKVIGSTEGEVFFNKQEALRFYLPTADQIAGKAELRNRIITVETAGNLVLVTEMNDFYILIEDNWTYYAKARLSTFFHKKEGDWKIIQQHGSMPDIRAVEGEQFALEKISKENLELRDAVKRRTVELEQKNRELEIEMSLERVRAIAMGMNKADDMLDVCRIIAEQMELLGTSDIRNVQTAIFYPEKKSYRKYEYYRLHDKYLITDVDYSNHKMSSSFAKKMLEGAGEFFSESLIGKAVQDWYEFQKTTEQFPDSYLETATSLTYYWFSLGPVALGCSTYTPLAEEEISLFKRFRNVFELAYRRFLDIQQAAEQAREAQIELALERVRARTMAMKVSGELAETASVLFQQIKDLGFHMWSCGFCIWSADDFVEVWMNADSGGLLPPMTIPYKKEPTHRDIYEASQKGALMHERVWEGEALEKHYEFLQTIPSVKEAIDILKESALTLPERQCYYVGFFKHGYLLLITKEPKEGAGELTKRFARVFDQTYTRFIDLQKAETQARDSKIQLALERVRARTMAMQKSDELAEAASLLFQQVKSLGIETFSSGYTVWDNDEKDLVSWMCNADGSMNPPFIMPVHENALHTKIYESWKSDETIFVEDMSGETMQEYYRYLRSFPLLDEAFKKSLAAGYEVPERQVHNIANFSHGNLLFITYEAYPEYHDIFIRFAKVFDQTYTRFLDLQKAEAQTRGAQIEVAVERVRARALAMHKSEEIIGVTKTMRTELDSLNVSGVMSATIYLEQDDGRIRFWDLTIHTDGESKDHFSLDQFLNLETAPSYLWFQKIWSSREKYFIVEQNEQDLLLSMEWIRLNVSEEIAVSTVAFFKANNIKHLWHPTVQLNHGRLNIDFTEAPPAEMESILLKMGAAFDLAYKRFLDLKHAEAQAREAQIELGLERVRARAMAMQKSDELKELIGTVFTELIKLDFVLTRCVIMIYDPATMGSIWWMANSEAPSDPIGLFVQYHQLPPYLSYLKAWQERNPRWQYVLEGKTKEEWDEYLFSQTGLSKLPDFVIDGMKAPDKVILSSSFNNFGNLTLATLDTLSEEHTDIMFRFARVFDLTYTRFNDLQKAEAQAREAEIELALERIRARTMAMQKSEELGEISFELFKQVQSLGIAAWHCAFNIYDTDQNSSTEWGTNVGGIYPAYKTPRVGIFLTYYEIGKTGETLHIEVIGEDKSVAHYAWLCSLPGVGEELLKLKNAGISFPTSQIDHVAYFKYGYLLFISYEPAPEAHEIFKRFAIVFEQTYTRFLDLQKAEAQTKESQIQLALERVRARTMAMQKSDELRECVLTIYEQLQNLDFDSNACNIIIIDKESGDTEYWVSGFTQKIFPEGYQVPYLHHPYHENLLTAYLENKKYTVMEYSGKMKQSFDEMFFTQTDFRNVPEQAKQFMIGLRSQKLSTAFFTYGALQVLGPEALSDDKAEILQRFGIVFEQTYTRFLDLQKAEAQAREAQIEAALEKVRSRTLAMQKSDELSETAAEVFRQLIALGIEPNRLYIGLVNDESGDMEMWATDEDGTHVGKKFMFNKNENVSVLKLYDGWKAQKKSVIVDMQGEELHNYFQYLSNVMRLPFKGGLTQKRRVQSVAYFSKGFIGMASPDGQGEETIQLLERFAAVFNLTYTRFNDLQVAEAQTQKAKIEAALERVRARALAMQQPEELKEVAEVLRHEMGLLGVEELETCSIYINDEQAEKAECWYALKDIKSDEKKLVNDHFALNLNDTWVGREMLQFYNSAAKQTSIVMQGENRREWIRFCEENSPLLRGYYGEVIPDRTYHLYKFSHGAIGAAVAGEISNESWDLLQRAASVFSLAYSRFKDLTQARIDLLRLKEEKQRAEDALSELQVTQKQLIQSEKMASLGELTAGIAHEIQNPLNFVNNFSEVSTELLDEMIAELGKSNPADAIAIADDLKQNLEKILHHGKRADGIVKGMLQHSRSSSGIKEPTNINTLADEYLRLAYHGLRAKDKSFNAILKTDYDETIGDIEIIPQDIGRLILNLITNAFYAVEEKRKKGEEMYRPTVSVSTKNIVDRVEVNVKDNGIGISQKVMDKIFQPFFTTKPTGQGTGLGLSLSYDIVKAHGGELRVETREGEGSEFIVSLPA